MIKNTKSTKSTLKGDLPCKIIKEFAMELSDPLAHIFQESISQHEYPQLWKEEQVTSVPKVFPPETENDIRKISGTPFFSKTFERFIVEWIQEDISQNMDPASYGGVPGMSTTHYMVKLVHDILKNLDNNSKGEKNAAIATFYDWSKAFDMQCHKLGILSFMNCGVRNSILPLLVSYFQNRTMTVKYRTAVSSKRSLPGGGAQGTLIGPIEYSCQSNNSADCVPEDKRYKYVDDLTTLEILSLSMQILTSHNFKQNVASDIDINNQIIQPENIQTQKTVNEINEWTKNQKMQLNAKKTKYMIINYTHKFQFNTRLTLENTTLDCISQIKLLGVELRDDLSWRSNTSTIIRKSYARMSLLRKLIGFKVSDTDLVIIYMLYIRSLLENCCVLWHSSITEEETNDLERVQKCAIRIILQDRYTDYETGLEELQLTKLKERRGNLCISFSKNCLKNPQTKNWFPKNLKNEHDIRDKEQFVVTFANNERFKESTIPYLQRLLNENSSH